MLAQLQQLVFDVIGQVDGDEEDAAWQIQIHFNPSQYTLRTGAVIYFC